MMSKWSNVRKVTLEELVQKDIIWFIQKRYMLVVSDYRIVIRDKSSKFLSNRHC